MTDIFRIETNETSLTWSGRVHPEDEAKSLSMPGRLAISPRSNLTIRNIETFRLGITKELSSDATSQIGPRLHEETSYSLFLKTNAGSKVELRHRDPVILQGLNTSNGQSVVHGSINFRSQVGLSRFTVVVDDKPEYDFEVEVFPSKLDYKSDYDALLADVQDILAGLVLEYLQSTFTLGFATQSTKATKLEWITLLRHLIHDLERAIRYISQHPQHGLIRERLPTRVERLRRPDATIFKMVIQGKGMGPKSKMTSGLVVHTKLPEHRARVTLDTPEHRWLSFQLTRIRRQLAHIHMEERNRIAKDQEPRPRQSRTLEEIAELENRVALLERSEPIAEAQGFVPAGFTSLKLQASPGYREAYRACLTLMLGLRIAGGPVGLSVKQVHRLYEYWCYLALLRLLAEITGERIPVSNILAAEQNGLRVQLQRGRRQTVIFSGKANRSLELTYNPSYSGDAFIFTQRPDVVLTLRDPAWPKVQLVLDAKYRIRSDSEYVTQLGSPGPPDDAINVLHRYRDAILKQKSGKGTRSDALKRTVIEGVALFPHCDKEDKFRTSRLWTSLQQLGIGALPFLPSETRYVDEWLRSVLERGGWSTAESSIPYTSEATLREWEGAANESVFLATIGPDALTTVDWITQRRQYHTALNPFQPRQLIARWLAIYSASSFDSRGAITHIAQIAKIEIKRVAETATHTSSEQSEEMQVVYHLEEVKRLNKPIKNLGPVGLDKRFSLNPWTSKLGVLRASELREVFLEAPQEWKLYEQLKMAGVDFTLRPGAGRSLQQGEDRGRTWFVMNDIQIQYRESAGFVIKQHPFNDQYRANPAQILDLIVGKRE